MSRSKALLAFVLNITSGNLKEDFSGNTVSGVDKDTVHMSIFHQQGTLCICRSLIYQITHTMSSWGSLPPFLCNKTWKRKKFLSCSFSMKLESTKIPPSFPPVKEAWKHKNYSICRQIWFVWSIGRLVVDGLSSASSHIFFYHEAMLC